MKEDMQDLEFYRLPMPRHILMKMGIVKKLADIMGDQLNIYNCVQLLVATLVRAYHLGNERTLKRQFDLQVLSELPLCWCIGQKAGLANL